VRVGGGGGGVSEGGLWSENWGKKGFLKSNMSYKRPSQRVHTVEVNSSPIGENARELPIHETATAPHQVD